MWGREVLAVERNDDRVTIEVRGDNGSERHDGAYLIGADGGRSTVRKSAGIAFEGFTWPERFIVLTTPFDFAAHRGYGPRSYFADPDEWCNCFNVSADGPPGLWRTVFPADPAASDDALMSDEAVQARLQKFFPVATALRDRPPQSLCHASARRHAVSRRPRAARRRCRACQ